MTATVGKIGKRERARQKGYDAGYGDALSLAEADSRDRMVTTVELAHDTGLPAATFRILLGLGLGPVPVRVGEVSAYLLSDVDAWRRDVERRRADEKAAITQVIDMFREIGEAFGD